jgi:gamma-glutamyltranspeptidase/glutathione hydrolase
MRDFQTPGRSAVFAMNGMCATSHPAAARVAIDLLREGGSAVDAALGAAAILCVAEPQMCGLAGDCFALIRPGGTDAVIAVNGSGRAPATLHAAALRDRGMSAVPVHGVESVTVPGAVDAFCEMSRDWGRMPLDQVLAPAIAAAEDGLPVAPRVARDWLAEGGVLQGAARDVYLNAGRAPVAGDVFRQPGIGAVLRAIAKDGRAGFYEGPVAEDIVSSLRALGGSHTLDDLAATRTTCDAPIRSSYRGVELTEHGPNGQGATACLILNILAHFDLEGLDPMGADRLHLEAEASKLAYDARDRIIADADHTTRLAHMLSPDTAARLAALIDPRRALPDPARSSEAVHRDTVYLTVVDGDRTAVSLIFSIFHAFGSGLASNRYGLLFQNRGAGFTLTKGHPNELAGGKRPMHTIIPAMLGAEGRVTMPFGVMGGAYQPCGHARFVSNIRDFGMDMQTAMDMPRSFAAANGLQVEALVTDATRAALADKGHIVVPTDGPMGGSQAILMHDTGVLEGASDPRKDGCALGY